MGTRHSVRSVPDSSLHVDRSVLHRCTISLSQRAGIVDLCQARCRRDPFRRNLFPTFSFALCFPTTTRKRLDRCDLRLVSGSGRALQSFPVTARSALALSRQYLCPPSSRRFPDRRNGLVRVNRSFPGADLSASHHRHRCRCLLWSWARNFSQDKWHFALERTARLRSLFAGSVFIFAPLPSSMSAL